MPNPNASDLNTTVAELRKKVDDFVTRRDWHQFHSPKNLAMSIAIEASELMEHFQWISSEASRDLPHHTERLGAIRDELADVLCYALAMANTLGVDLTTAIQEKMAKNEQKYPADEFRGRYGADDPRKSTGQRESLDR